MHTHIIIDQIKAFHLIFGGDLLLGHLVASFDLLDEPRLIILHVAFLKNDWSHFMFARQSIVLRCSFSATLIILISSILISRGSGLRCIALISRLLVILILLFLNLRDIKHSDSIILIIIFSCPLGICKLLMCFSYILLRRKCEICCLNHSSKNTIIQLISNFLSVLKTKIVSDKSWGNAHNFDKFVLEHKRLTRQQINFKDHLIGNRIDVIRINFQLAIF